MERNAFEADAEVLENAPAGGHYLRLVLAAPEIARLARPGQFVNLRAARGLDPLLGRPFSVFFAEPETGRVELLYKPAGRGTELLAAVRPGEKRRVVGPLGRPFRLEPEAAVHVAVGGGTGLAPVYFLAADALRQGLDARLVFGFRDCSYRLPEELMRRAGESFRLASDAGEAGCHRGTAVDLLEALLAGELAGRAAAVYAAGPGIMMKLAFESAARRGLPCQVSLEAHMACGLSVCRGCVVAVKGEHPGGGPLRRPVCTYGPVFPAAEVDWESYLSKP